MRYLTKLSRFLLLALLLIALLSCKSDKEKDRAWEPHSEQSMPPEEQFVIRFRQKWHPQAQFAGMYMALEKGFYRQYGLDVRLQPHAADSLVFRRLYNRHTDIIQVDLLNAIIENAQGLKVVNIGQISQESAQLLVGKKSRGINSVEDFAGKKIGLWRSGSHHISRIFLAKEKLDMQIIPINWSINLFTSNAIDVINVMRFNEYNQMRQAGIKEEELFVADLSELGYVIPDDGFYVSKEFYDAHHDVCKNFIAATIDGWHYAFAHPDETLDVVLHLMQKNNIRANRSHQKWMLDNMRKIVLKPERKPGLLAMEDYHTAINLLQEYFMPVDAIPFEEFCPND